MTPRDRRAVTWGGAIVLTAVLSLRIVPWAVRRGVTAEDALRERVATLTRARADLADASVLRDSAVALTRAVVDLAPKLLSGDTPADAMADLAGRLNLAAARAPAKLTRTDQLADSGIAGRLHRVRLRAELESDVRGVGRFLRAVERGDAVLSIEQLRIGASDPNGAVSGPEVLRGELTVTGWFLGARDARKGAVGA